MNSYIPKSQGNATAVLDAVKAVVVSATAGCLARPTAIAFLRVGREYGVPDYSVGGRTGAMPDDLLWWVAGFGIPIAMVIAPAAYYALLRRRNLILAILAQWLGAFCGGAIGAALGGFFLAAVAAPLGLLLGSWIGGRVDIRTVYVRPHMPSKAMDDSGTSRAKREAQHDCGDT